MIYNSFTEVDKARPHPDEGEECRVAYGKGKYSRYDEYIICPSCNRGRWVPKYTNQSKYCSKCWSTYNAVGNLNGQWNGGVRLGGRKGCYKRIRVYPDSPYYSMADHSGYVKEHRLVMAQHLGRPLEPWEIVHHKPPGIKDDNRYGNLELTTLSEHSRNYQKRMSDLEDRVMFLEARNTTLEAEVALLKAQLEKDGVQF